MTLILNYLTIMSQNIFNMFLIIFPLFKRPPLQRAVLRWPVGAPLQPDLFQALSQQRHLPERDWSVCVSARILGGHLSEQ